MSTNTKKSVNSVNNIVESVNVPNMDRNAAKYERKPIINLEVVRTEAADLFDVIDEEVYNDSLRMASGKNHVKLIGCFRVKKFVADAPNKEWLEMHLKDANGIEAVVSLFPGNQYTDKMGVVHPAGHNWKAFAEEIKRQQNAAGIGMAPMKLGEILTKVCTKGFDTWLLDDGKYMNMYATEDKYQNALTKLAKDKQKGSPEKNPSGKDTTSANAPWED